MVILDILQITNLLILAILQIKCASYDRDVNGDL